MRNDNKQEITSCLWLQDLKIRAEHTEGKPHIKRSHSEFADAFCLLAFYQLALIHTSLSDLCSPRLTLNIIKNARMKKSGAITIINL